MAPVLAGAGDGPGLPEDVVEAGEVEQTRELSWLTCQDSRVVAVRTFSWSVS